jgi:hypothetical protein
LETKSASNSASFGRCILNGVSVLAGVFTLPLLLLFGNPAAAGRDSAAQPKQKSTQSHSGTLEKMIVASGSVVMDIDLNQLNGSGSATQKLETLHFTVAPNSFFTILVFNNVLRGAQFGSAMALIPQSSATLPAALSASLDKLVVEKLPSGAAFDLAVRDGKTGFVFFNIEGDLYDYDANAQSLSITEGRLLVSKEFANALGRPSQAGSAVGKISVGAAMQPIEITQLADGEAKSVVMPPLRSARGGEAPTLVAGPDVIVGELPSLEQFGSAGTQVGLAVGTDSCNNGDQPLNWFSLPNNDHPVIPQNLYRQSRGPTNDERFEQIGQSSMKHAFLALEDNVCNLGCNTSGCATGTHLCPGCSDPYSAGLNAGPDLGSRAWVNPFTGFFPTNPNPNDHNGHVHNGVSHRIIVGVDDLNVTLNPGATYFAEAQYVTPHEYAWCQAHPGQCNMLNNASYRRYNVSGITNFSFSPVGPTVRMQPAIMAWTGATVTQIEPDAGNDGIFFVGYKVTGPSAGMWHYEYAVYNQNLDRAIQSFTVPWGPGANFFNIEFHAPPQHPGWAHDGTVGDAGYSSVPWTFTVNAGNLTVTWNTQTFAQNPNANAIRWGTLYNFRFDSNNSPLLGTATIGFFKTGSPITVEIPAPFVPPTFASPYDFNHDSKPDFVLYNGSTRRTAIWYMHNNVYAGGAFGPILPAGWSLIDVADFNRDGNNDYALFNSSTRQTAIWYLSGNMITGSAWGPTLPSGWALVATGDFNGDGKPDYVLYKPSTGQTGVWYLNNNVYAGGAFGPTLPAGWRLAGVADFNGNGKRDYALFNPSTRQTAIYYLSGTMYVSSALGPTIGSGYELMGTADFNGNGKPDDVLYNASTRQTALYYLNNNVYAGSALGPTLPAGWNLVAP